jgi:tetratricopeptide (TPR) repeat protein
MSLRQIAVAALALLFCSTLARAQLSEDYRFQGEVVDQQGKPIPSVQVILHDAGTGTRIVFVTNADGTFDRRMVPRGTYDATFSKAGYVPFLDRFDWSAESAQTIVKVARIVLESDVDRARKELGKKEAKLYEEAYAALTANDFPTARRKAEELLELGAGSYEYAVRFVIARAEAMQGELDPAVAEYGRVLALKPDLFEAHFDLAGVYEKEGKIDEALKEFARAAEINPTDAETQYDLGVILLKQKQDYEQAKVHLAKAIELDPTHSQATKALGFANLWAEKQNVPEGVRLLKRYLELEPKAGDSAQVMEVVRSFEVVGR